MDDEPLGPEYIMISESGFPFVIINEEEWPVNHLWPSALKKLQQGEDSILEELSDRVNSDGSLRSERDHLPELLYYEAHAIAAAYGQQDLAGRIYTQGKLDGTAWLSSEIDEYPLVCPICFELRGDGKISDWREDCSRSHMVLMNSYLGWDMKYGKSDLGQQCWQCQEDSKGPAVISLALDDSDNFDALKSTLLTDDLIGRCLQKASQQDAWWEELPSATALRCHSATCDVDRFGDTHSFYFHPEPEKFVADVREAERQMVKRCRDAGLDRIGDYFE
jgi:hypothetical protein